MLQVLLRLSGQAIKEIILCAWSIKVVLRAFLFRGDSLCAFYKCLANILICRVRKSTWKRLQQFVQSGRSLSGALDDSLRRDPLYPILTAQHLEAIDRRHAIIMRTIEQCISRHGKETVLVDMWGRG